MRKNYSHIILFFLLISASLGAQNFSMEFGKVSQAEFDLKSYYLDKSAEALVLFDKGESVFEYNYGMPMVTFTRTTRIKILNNAGLSYAEIQVPLKKHPALYQALTSLKGYTHNLIDSVEFVSELDSSQSYIEHLDEYTDLLKVAMPMVREGSIIEYSYSYQTNYFFNLPEWNFQAMIPTVYSSYSVQTSPVMSFKYLLRGPREFDTIYSEPADNMRMYIRGIPKSRNHTYVMKNLPAVVEEELISSYKDLISSQTFQVSKIMFPNGRIEYIQSSWWKLIENYLQRKDFGKFMVKSRRKLRAVKKELGIKKLPENELYESLVSYVKESFTWDYFESQTADQSVKEFYFNRTGNSSEINLFLVGLLQAAGFESAPLLISTKGNGSVNKDYPFSHQLNYLVTATRIEGKWVLTDATDPMISHYSLPPKCINDEGLLIRSGKPEWLRTSVDNMSEEHCSINIALDGDYFEAAIENRAYSLDAYIQRSLIGKDTAASKDIARDNYILAENLVASIENYESIDKPFVRKYHFRHEVLKIDDRLYLTPFLAEALLTNPLKQTKRVAPVDMDYPWLKTYTSTIEVPPGYEIDYLPEALQISNQNYQLDFHVVQDGNTIIFSMTLHMKKSVFQPEEYDDLKEFYHHIVKKSREKLVLKKISTM